MLRERLHRIAGQVLGEESYFKTCDRDDKGRCLPSGESGQVGGTSLSKELTHALMLFSAETTETKLTRHGAILRGLVRPEHAAALARAKIMAGSLDMNLLENPRSALGDTKAYGAEASVLSFLDVPAADAVDRLDYLAADLGLASRQMSVLNVVEDKTGPDRFWTIEHRPGIDVDEVGRVLDRAGIEYRTIDYAAGMVHVLDDGMKLGGAIAAATKALGGKTSSFRGRGWFVGVPPWETATREEAATRYRKILERLGPVYGASRRAESAQIRVRAVQVVGWPTAIRKDAGPEGADA